MIGKDTFVVLICIGSFSASQTESHALLKSYVVPYTTTDNRSELVESSVVNTQFSLTGCFA